MPQGDKSKYSDKQMREAEHIAEGYRKRGKDEGWSKKVAWATVNKVRFVLSYNTYRLRLPSSATANCAVGVYQQGCLGSAHSAS